MGKKSRGKRERSRHKAIEEAVSLKVKQISKQADARFAKQRTDLETWLSEFNAEDACVSISVSDLWLPNISSQVKHTFAFGVIASMNPDRFSSRRRIETYQEFRDFATELHAHLPSFPMLEDYVPEADWGEIRIESCDSRLRCFYGGAVERIPDYVAAFLMLQEPNSAAHRDMHVALTTQDHLIANIDRSLIGSAAEIDSGHIEVPAEPFWVACKKVLLSIADLPDVQLLDKALITSLGQFIPPATSSAFGDSVMNGTALPVFLLDVGTCRVPIALRNALASVIDLWVGRTNDPNALVKAASTTIGDFLGDRFDSDNVFPGPLRLVTGNERLPYTFAAAITGQRQMYLFLPISEGNIKQLPTIERAVNALLSSNDWGLLADGATHWMQIRKNDGTLPSLAEVTLIAVLARVSTGFGFINLPKTSARVIPLPDFVTLLDSVKDINELERLWEFDKANSAVRGPIGLIDQFAAFRDSHALLSEGAITPDLIALDPHWGSSWRYRQLEKIWANVPPLFPFGHCASWESTNESDRLFRLVAKPKPILSWCTVVDNCVVHFLFELQLDLGPDNGRLLEILVHCLADSLAQRQAIIANLPVFQHRQIVTTCQAHGEMLAALGEKNAESDERPLFLNWTYSVTPLGDLHANVQVNLQAVRQRILAAKDARFEVEAALAWIDGLSEILDTPPVPDDTRASILTTADRKPRFVLREYVRDIDVPQFASPIVPGPEHYKIARRDLAIVFKELSVQEGIYELVTAKAAIDPARDKFRSLVHERIASLRRDTLITFCIEQLDALMTKYDTAATRIELSLTHEVNYDRSEDLADAHDDFVRNSSNYRYLLECCVSTQFSGTSEVTEQKVIELVATIDWLHVLSGASDVLHNGIDVAGLKIDHHFIPHIFYSQGRDERESAFATETADLRLGIDVTSGDVVPAIAPDSIKWQQVNSAFADQVGVQLIQFLRGLLVLSRWPSVCKSAEFHWSYSATMEQLRKVLVESVVGLSEAQANIIISLATLDPKGVRRLLGKSIDESDIPTWEHNKRGDRYTIKPLIAMEDGSFQWGAAAAERAARIWRSNITNGYMPADYDWPKVSAAVRTIKAQLDNDLEVMAHTIVKRGTMFAMHGIDLMRRFPKEKFEDVGDYDVLAFWPELNLWLAVECKHNQPAFCIKDARRLRERIFGGSSDLGQFVKIERRRAFLAKNSQKLRTLLAWPVPREGTVECFSEVYVSREIFWWMRNPPYDVPTEFVRVDVLSQWLWHKSLLSHSNI